MPDLQTCGGCKRLFEATTVGGGMTSPEPEPMTCPYCGFTRLLLNSGRFVTRALPEDDIRRQAPPDSADAS